MLKILWLELSFYGDLCYIHFMLRFILLKKMLKIFFGEIQENVVFVQQYQILKYITEGTGINLSTLLYTVISDKIYFGFVLYN